VVFPRENLRKNRLNHGRPKIYAIEGRRSLWFKRGLRLLRAFAILLPIGRKAPRLVQKKLFFRTYKK
jgi:hypothetical protein